MAWQTYIDDQLLKAGFCYAAIVSLEGATWAASPGYTVLPEEAKMLSTLLGGTSLDSVSSSGFNVAGQKYAFTRGEVDDEEGGVPFIQGRCKEDGKSSQGIIVMKTTQALIVGVHDPAYSNGASFGKVNTDIGRIADYMMESGF
mmetsp:Transcript_51811/g.127172  ORF Transcript_51811/g.127172 Transcript_51811/m.127172 type:complete len:144 (-) Transcript_51811:147-578(-)|eukprot:CAMPEP_0198340492 /NCGR_PEP_ID=MMETSP1450-20131203/44670_1 /TAXON_ID=753684 ORGANISM="Madagascaria erythrocladiodes, Strain CCMP3234" /NCGR_SAMPLE_ID=MMETSP1450 /ASSEMBLY_ACC=CAM_ASM_001115 /LENGTH=143 /DNA_ID=CAMNT_0044045475 /DNA_START=83 /DNA_END=514 /DNA_ORIENTATION=+